MAIPDLLIALNEISSAPTAPSRLSGAGWGTVPRSWDYGQVDRFTVEVFARGANAVTGAKLMAGVPEALAALTAKTFTAAGFASSQLTATSHTFVTGDGPVYLTNSGGALPTGLVASKGYWLYVVDANTVSLCASARDAMNAIVETFTSADSGTSQIVKSSGAQAPTCRIQWLSTGLLGEANDGALTLTSALGYQTRCDHNPCTVAYSLQAATFGTASATTCVLRPLSLNVGK